MDPEADQTTKAISELAGPQPELGFASLTWEPKDHHRWVTGIALVGLLIAAAMALFGLPPVDLHPPIHRLGIMDPLCGGTRAARFAAQGRLTQAWRYNPLGIAVVLGALLALLRTGVGLWTHRWVTMRVAWTPKRRRVVMVVVILLVGALEIRQQMRADLLISGT